MTPTGLHSGCSRISNINNQTVMVAPATDSISPRGAGRNEVRVAYVLKIDDLRLAMETLAEALKVYPAGGGEALPDPFINPPTPQMGAHYS